MSILSTLASRDAKRDVIGATACSRLTDRRPVKGGRVRLWSRRPVRDPAATSFVGDPTTALRAGSDPTLRSAARGAGRYVVRRARRPDAT